MAIKALVGEQRKKNAFWKSLVLLATVLSGCATGGANQRGSGALICLEEFRELVDRGEADRARELLSAATRERIGGDEWRSFVAERKKQLASRLAPLFEKESPLGEELVLVDSTGAMVRLAKEQGAWRILDGFVLPEREATPDATVESFLRAIDAADCKTVVTLAPPGIRALYQSKALRKGCEQELPRLRALGEKIRAGRQAAKFDSETTASIAFGEKQSLQLIRVEEQWYIDDIGE